MFGCEEEINQAGRRLDSARDALDLAVGEWARAYWDTVVLELERQWRQMVFRIDNKA